jgi:arylsulfatase A
MAADEVTLAEALKAKGYRTGLFGKWHLGENYPHVPHAQGFDEYIGFRTGHTDNYFDAQLERNGLPYQTRGYITDALTDETIRFIEQNRARPFFAYVPYNAPHTPLQCPEKYVASFRALGLPERTARIYGMIANLDENIGRLLRRLDELNLAENTLVIFLSDNGMIWGRDEKQRRFNAGLRDQKFTVYEGGVRAPFLLRAPKAQAKVVTTAAAHIDVLPTVLDYCGIKQPARLDGVSLRPLIEGRNSAWPERRLFMNYSLATLEKPAPYPGGFAHAGRYKMVNGAELYDLQTDPGEEKNLAAAQPALLAELDAAYRRWWNEVTAAPGFALAPIPVGHRAENPATVTMHVGRATGGLKFQGVRDAGVLGFHPTGVDGDWLTNWTSVNDSIRWELDVARAGRYEIMAVMRCPSADAGSRVRLEFGAIALEGAVPIAEAGKGAWQTRSFGVVRLRRGRTPLSLRATSVPGKQVMELLALQFRRLE